MATAALAIANSKRATSVRWGAPFVGPFAGIGFGSGSSNATMAIRQMVTVAMRNAT